MRERRGRIGRTVGAVADSIASAARRGGPRAGEARVVVYDRAGHATLLRSGTPEHEQIADVVERIIALWREPAGGQAPDSESGADAAG
jgi:hypothetical protein